MSIEVDSLRKHLESYECHKHVHAAAILDVRSAPMTGNWIITLDVPGNQDTIEMRPEHEFVKRCKATDRDLGYLVVYEDGFISWSPTEAFRNGYVREAKPD